MNMLSYSKKCNIIHIIAESLLMIFLLIIALCTLPITAMERNKRFNLKKTLTNKMIEKRRAKEFLALLNTDSIKHATCIDNETLLAAEILLTLNNHTSFAITHGIPTENTDTKPIPSDNIQQWHTYINPTHKRKAPQIKTTNRKRIKK